MWDTLLCMAAIILVLKQTLGPKHQIQFFGKINKILLNQWFNVK